MSSPFSSISSSPRYSFVLPCSSIYLELLFGDLVRAYGCKKPVLKVQNELFQKCPKLIDLVHNYINLLLNQLQKGVVPHELYLHTSCTTCTSCTWISDLIFCWSNWHHILHYLIYFSSNSFFLELCILHLSKKGTAQNCIFLYPILWYVILHFLLSYSYITSFGSSSTTKRVQFIHNK